jgi:hypothetical protein
LLAALAKKNASVADANEQAKKLQQEKDAAEKAERDRAQVAVDTAAKATEEAKAQQATFAEDRSRMDDEKNKLTTQIAATATKAKADVQKQIDEKELFVKQNTNQKSTIEAQLDRLKKYKTEEAALFENPDGHIKLVNQRQRLVWIDVGRADGLLRQTTFSVFDHDENGVSNAKRKARIEVVNLDEHLAEARILEDTPANPIIIGDVIFSPAWSPGQRVHFALAMKMDINKDGIDDYDMVKNIIEMNGGVIDAELRKDGTRGPGNISVNTRYFVEGEKPSDTTKTEVQKQYNAFEEDRKTFGVEKISVDKLLALMGWKADEKTVDLSGIAGGGDFRKRPAGKTQPAKAAAPAAGGSTPPPAAVDPFTTGPAASAPAPATAPAAAPAGAEVDPFAPPK